jgi:hypothetical protein
MARRHRRRTRWPAIAFTAILTLALAPGIVQAHDVTGSRFDAPLPLSLLFAGASATVALTALWLAVTDHSLSEETSRPVATIDAHTARWARLGAGGVFFVGFCAALVIGTVGRQVAAENFATIFTWPVWFRGVGLVAIVFGTPWNTLSPWKTLYWALCSLEGKRIAILGEYPDRLGSWPALFGFLALIGVVENLTVIPRSPSLTTVILSLYALAMVGGAVCFGPTWFDRADPLGVLYRLFGRVSGVSTDRTASGDVRVAFRPPWYCCRRPVAGFALAAFVVAAVYTVSFDGFTNTQLYQTLLFDVRDALGTGPPTSVLLYLSGLVVFVGTFAVTGALGDTLGTVSGAGREVAADGGTTADWVNAVRAFAPTVLPIAAAYDVAHNYPYVIRSTARLAGIVAEPLGTGGGLGSIDPLGWLSLPVFWGSQVFLIVVGHVVAVVAAHHVAVERYASVSAARRGHLPLVVLMVGYTVLSLWIISQPVVGG